jgi:hypothetical protein
MRSYDRDVFMSAWVQDGNTSWRKEIKAAFGTVAVMVRQVDYGRPDYSEDGWLPSVAVVEASDARYTDWTSGYIAPLPLLEAQDECERIVQELIVYGPGEWIDGPAVGDEDK